MRLRPQYILTTFLSLFFIGCHTNIQPAVARTNDGKFHETPVKYIPTPLQYDTLGMDRRLQIIELDEYYRKQVKAGFNGSVLVGVNGKIVYERYFGLCNRERHMPLAVNSSSQLASISKTFTSAAILYLMEHKYLDLNDPVQKHIKEFPYPNITIKMLLNHRSGLPDYTKWVPIYNTDTRTPITNAKVLELMQKHKLRLESKPNTRFKYCNTNFAVLARIVEKITDMSFADFMSQYIFQPLGMVNSFVYDPWKGLPANATISYRANWAKEPDMFADGVTGDKGIYCTVQDMFRWDQSFYQKKLLSAQTIDLAYLPCSFEKPGVKNYGLGWRMLCFPNGKVIYHNGWWHGNNTSFYRLTRENRLTPNDITIIVLGNKHTNIVYHQAPVIYNIISKGAASGDGFDTDD